MSHTFCADLSREQHDPLAGSAAHADRNLLISWPRAKWTRNLRHASDMPDNLVRRLDAIAAEGRRVNLIHRREQPGDIHQVFLMPERRRFVVPRAALEAFLAAWQSGSPLTEWERGTVDRELVLCCTHGKKDKCCAKYGYQTYKQLAEVVATHALPFEVWESSHLGGCRFAASIILLAPVRKYGRITPEQALPFLQAEARGCRFLPGYRGDSRLTPAQQCAQLAALTSLEPRYPAARLTLQEDTGDEHRRRLLWRWERADAQGRLQVVCETTTIRRVDTCSDLHDGPSDSLVWQATEVTALQA
ncbi:sucrase ferredoxin [Halomonas nitroreducens]|uniref:Sucrase ferredoxin n=1 Tax=Halomonas nitroreducens TaxID=447425 RepID=A0A3S0K1M4_9GAMM|nr:sucrase ferredoxin [Halomonas nitroreducens]RTR00819.1 sucrase ferredoxin [Halomonas nitroreducens]